jgi:NAD(P)-dependent dehydrogenase (short-subunit alcohol dehydrogenase family)
MELKDKVIVVTGAASGIGRALCVRFAAEGAKAVVCADRDGPGAKATAEMVGGRAVVTDVSQEAQIVDLIDTVESEIWPIDLFCSNAGIGVGGGA